KDEGIYKFLKDEAKTLLNKLNIKTIGFEEDDLRVSEFKSFKKIVNLKPVDLTNLRIIKTNGEIENIKLACKISDQAFNYILGKIKLGISEKEVANLIENFIKENNGEISFKTIVAFGKNSAIPHHQTSNIKLTKNQIILLDFGVKINNYCSDMTRTIYFGKAPEKFKKMHKTVLTAQVKAIKKIKQNTNASIIDKTGREYIINQNYPSISHSVGHGIGVEVHEAPYISPNSKDIIKNNMIFSVEPGIYFSNYGGVRIEDLVLVKNGLAELISHSNREIIELPC
nr:aminopeptidase P family protein [Candidatus Levybacteria bacterium]